MTLEHQPDFRLNDSWTNQVLLIVHGLYTAFDADLSLETCGAFLEMSKAFDKTWHEVLNYKLRELDISAQASKLIESFLKNRSQRVIKLVTSES